MEPSRHTRRLCISSVRDYFGGHLVFSRMTVTYSGAPPSYPAYRRQSVTVWLKFVSGYGGEYFWMF
jgi:hypothetical protein